MRRSLLAVALLLSGVAPADAQDPATCTFICAPEFKVEPTVTFANLFGSPRTRADDGAIAREGRETEFEVIFSIGCRRASHGWTSPSKRSFCPSLRRARPSSS